MNINERKYPFLKFLHHNHLKVDPTVFSEMSGYTTGIDEAEKILKHFENKDVPIYYVTKAIHDTLLDTRGFLGAKPILWQAPEMVGLLLLPQDLIPQVVPEDVQWRAQNLKMNAVLFSFLKWSTYDTIQYGKPEMHQREDYADDHDYNWEVNEYETGRWLHFLPIQLDKFFHIDGNSIASVAEEFGETYHQYGREINGNIIDYLWSFILLRHLSQSDPQTLAGSDTVVSKAATACNKIVLNESGNVIEIIDISRGQSRLPL